MILRHGDIVESKGGKRYTVVRVIRRDDDNDTFRLQSAEFGTIGRVWTADELKRTGAHKVER